MLGNMKIPVRDSQTKSQGVVCLHRYQVITFTDFPVVAKNEERSQFRLGVTIEKLARKIQIPLWVVNDSFIESIKNILCPVDFSAASERA